MPQRSSTTLEGSPSKERNMHTKRTSSAVDNCSEEAMAMDMLVLLKRMATGGDPHFYLHAALLFFFLLKLPIATRMRGSYTEMYFSLRLFLFRLNRVLFPDTPGRNSQRWQRALRLFQERVAEDARFPPNAQATEESLHSISMLAL
ncbi:hypothetical protein J5N97_029547 [Dioscorea zingiberensis]|uniref:Uncharacterized protein n=1 Tax=Dioscorea zingiberensis TaxID=325984 RepID=A0A9D5H5Z3_9LILI|nr:hypothetical protein J5N97_029547 [Dioscorea zingiberensis]